MLPQSILFIHNRASGRMRERASEWERASQMTLIKTDKRMLRCIRNANGAGQKQKLRKQACEIFAFSSANPAVPGSSVPIRVIRGYFPPVNPEHPVILSKILQACSSVSAHR